MIKHILLIFMLLSCAFAQDLKVEGEEKILKEYDSIEPPKMAKDSDLNIQNFISRFKIYEPWYIFPAYYSFSKPYSSKLQRVDFKSQISFRLELFNDLLCKFCTFSFDYSQKIYLQTYNNDYSSPLRDIDLSPQVSFIYKKPLYIGNGSYINWLSIAYRHISNGESEHYVADDPRHTVKSKALDRIIFEMNIKKGNFNARFRTWAILGLFDGKRTNPDINKYIGYGDVKLSYVLGNNLFEFSMNNIINNYFSKEYWNWKGNIELGYSYGVTKYFAIFAQYIIGHGDSLYEYNLPVNRMGVGVRLRDF